MQLTGGVPLHAGHVVSADLWFAVLLALAGLGSAILLGSALAAFVRRRSRSYLLVTLALATLFVRTAVAALSFAGSMGPEYHHWVEHGLDAVMAALVVAAVWDARRVRRSAESVDDPEPPLRSDGGRPRSTEESRDADEPHSADRGRDES